MFKSEHLNTLWASIGHLSQKLCPFKFMRGFLFKIRVSQYIMGHNRTTESKVMVV